MPRHSLVVGESLPNVPPAVDGNPGMVSGPARCPPRQGSATSQSLGISMGRQGSRGSRGVAAVNFRAESASVRMSRLHPAARRTLSRAAVTPAL